LAQVQFLAGKEIEAEESLKSAIRIEPGNTEALYALGRIYSQQRRYPESVDLLKKVVEIDPAHYRAWDNLGVCYDSLNQDADALKSFFKALGIVMKQQPAYDWAHANLADFFLRRNQFEKAFQLAAEAAKRNPDSARNCFLTGKALVKLEKEDLSLRWLERAVQLDAAYSEAWYLLSQAYRKQGRADDSKLALEKFRELKQSGNQERK
jgi:predicted Zn-dependent protease